MLGPEQVQLISMYRISSQRLCNQSIGSALVGILVLLDLLNNMDLRTLISTVPKDVNRMSSLKQELHTTQCL